MYNVYVSIYKYTYIYIYNIYICTYNTHIHICIYVHTQAYIYLFGYVLDALCRMVGEGLQCERRGLGCCSGQCVGWCVCRAGEMQSGHLCPVVSAR